MGECRFCGQPAGLLRQQHADCLEKHQRAATTLPDVFRKAFSTSMTPRDFRREFDKIAAAAWIGSDKRKAIVMEGLSLQADEALKDHVLTAEEEARLVSFVQEFEVGGPDFSSSDLNRRLVKAAVLRDLDDRIFKSRVQFSGAFPIVLARDEELVWAFPDTDLWEMKTRSQYVGGSHGVSLRLMKGVYYRVGATKSQRIQTTNLEKSDTGLLAISTKHLFFAGSIKTFRMALKKIVAVKLFQDAIEVTKDGANPKPQTFFIDSPEFMANVISRLV